MKHSDINVRHYDLSTMLSAIDAGEFAIPRLQREFVWDGSKAALLFDSILKGLPIGAIMIWEAPRSQRLNLRQKYHVLPPFNVHNQKVQFLIDGQQRLSSLHHVRKGDILENSKGRPIDFSHVVLSLGSELDGQQIRYRRPVPDQYISLATVIDPDWRRKLRGLAKRKMARVAKCRRQILGYRVFSMIMNASHAEVRDSFLRINTQGIKVTTADAIFTRAESINLRDVVHEVRGNLGAGFSDLPDQPILFLLAAITGGNEARGHAVNSTVQKLTRSLNRNKTARAAFGKKWNRLGPSVGKAADYLEKAFDVLSREYLASDYMLIMLGYFFYLNQARPNKRQAAEIRKWFWATSVGSRYSGRDFNRSIPEDIKFFRQLAEGPFRKFRYQPQAEQADVRNAQYASRTAITCAVYCLLMSRGPVHLNDDGLNEIPLLRYAARANRKDRHHIFPRQIVANEGVSAKMYNSVANICLLVAEENQAIGAKRPRLYFKALNRPRSAFKRKMDRHLIPVDRASGIWNPKLSVGLRQFLRQRTQLICEALEERAGIALFRSERGR